METNRILNADYLDILFEGRNKDYGSYKMRKQYNKRVLFAGAISILFISGLFVSLFIKSNENVAEKIPQVIVEIADIHQPTLDEVKAPIPAPPTVSPPLLKTMNKVTPPVIKENDQVKEIDQPKEI